MPCHCQSDRRALALCHPKLAERFPELLLFAENGDWQFVESAGTLVATVGSCETFTSLAEIANFLRGVIDKPRFEELRAVWLEHDVPLEKQWCRLLKAERLAELAPADSSPLMRLLNEGLIETWYQPILHSRSLDLWGYECLMRARDEAGELISPATLLGWARQENLVFMLDRVCRETHLLNAGRALGDSNCRVLINFLPTAIYEPEFCLKTTEAAVRRGGLKPERIIFEVIETDQVRDTDHLRKILNFYRAKGFGVALDDVGSGYSGLTLLADLAPDLIKLDRDLIVKAVASDLHRQVCRMLVQLAHDHGKLILAEGVETEEQQTLVQDLGVDLLQGFLFGRPNPEPLAAAVAV